MRISIICSDPKHPVQPYLREWARRQGAVHQVELVQHVADLSGGEMLFLVSCGEIVRAVTRARYRATLTLHASDLPEGRGWSPQVWQVIEGRSRIAVTLLEAADVVDTGAIWAQRWIELAGHELHDEIDRALFETELALMDEAVVGIDTVRPRPQDARTPSYYRKRGPEDSRIDPARPLAEQFDLLRTCDPDRYPAFFEHRGHRYLLTVRKDTDAA